MGAGPGHGPCQACQSERQSPVASTFTTTPAGGQPGAGTSLGVGLSAVAITTALGARAVAVDVTSAALGHARALGAVETVHSADPVAEVRELTGGGAHVSLDAVGLPATAVASVRCLRRQGRHVQVGLLLGRAATFPMDLVVAQELTIYGSHGMPARDYPAMLELILSGRLQPQRLVDRAIGLDEAPAALMEMGEPAQPVGVALVDPRRLLS